MRPRGPAVLPHGILQGMGSARSAPAVAARQIDQFNRKIAK
jgi:hypothetical protein